VYQRAVGMLASNVNPLAVRSCSGEVFQPNPSHYTTPEITPLTVLPEIISRLETSQDFFQNFARADVTRRFVFLPACVL
jgi:hypothetical protein